MCQTLKLRHLHQPWLHAQSIGHDEIIRLLCNLALTEMAIIIKNPKP